MARLSSWNGSANRSSSGRGRRRCRSSGERSRGSFRCPDLDRQLERERPVDALRRVCSQSGGRCRVWRRRFGVGGRCRRCRERDCFRGLELICERSLSRRKLLVTDEAKDAADADAFVDPAAELGVLGCWDAGVVERDDLPLIVEHRRAGRARFGVCLVVQKHVEHIDDAVVAQSDLLLLAAWMLNDRDEVARDRLSFRRDQTVEAERPQDVVAPLDRHEREVELLVRQEEAGRVERHQHRLQRPAVDPVLVVELDRAARRRRRVRQDMVVGQQQPRRDERARAVADQPSPVVANVDPPDRSRSTLARLQETHIDKVRRVDDPLQHGTGRPQRLTLARDKLRRTDRPNVRVVGTEPIDPGHDPFRLVCACEPAGRRDRRDLQRSLVTALAHPLRRRRALRLLSSSQLLRIDRGADRHHRRPPASGSGAHPSIRKPNPSMNLPVRSRKRVARNRDNTKARTNSTAAQCTVQDDSGHPGASGLAWVR